MTNIKLSWGWNVGLLYTVFAAMIVALVVASSRQQIDLVSADYYKDELAYQQVLDAGRNQAALAGAIAVHADGQNVVVDFPAEFATLVKTGEIHFYAPANRHWDYTAPLHTGNNSIAVSRAKLRKTNYTIRIPYEVGGRNYYYQSQIDLNQ